MGTRTRTGVDGGAEGGDVVIGGTAAQLMVVARRRVEGMGMD